MKFYSIILILLLTSNCLGSLRDRGGEDCKQIQGMPGPEDFVIDREEGIMYISSHERRVQGEFGSLFWIDLKAKEKVAKKFLIEYPSSFRPHGISMANTPTGKKLFVLSHLDDYFGEAHSIEVFKIENKNLVHEKSITNENIVSPNDLFALPDGRIFVSNDHGEGGSIRKFFQDALALSSSAIAYFDGKTWHSLPQKMAFGNGIHYVKQNDKEIIYRASSLDKKVSKYELKYKDGLPYLDLLKDFELNSMIDNFELDDDGNILATGHYSAIQFLRNKLSKDNLSAIQIFRLTKDDKSEEIFSNSGRLISSASVGAIYRGRIYIGQVFEPFILECKAPK